MKSHLFRLCLLWSLASCVTVHSMAESIDGTWVASSDSMGSTLTLRLKSQASSVTGTGTYSVGAIRTGTLTIHGTYQRRKADLTLVYDHGEVVRLRATSTDDEHMAGTLTYKSGSVMTVKFARP